MCDGCTCVRFLILNLDILRHLVCCILPLFYNSEGETRDEILASATSKVRFNLGVMRMERMERRLAEVTDQNQSDKR
jgi:hypothetical protein